MASPLIVVILVASADASTTTTQAMTSAAEEALGPDAIVLVRDVAAMPDDPGAIALGEVLHADALAEISWRPDGTTAHVHVHATQGWEDRDLSFVAADASPERGRTIGFALASMLPAKKEPATPSVEPPPPAPPPSVTPPDVSPTPAPIEHASPRLVVDLLAVGALGLGGDAGGAGAEAIARWKLGAFAPLVDAGFRRGEISSIGASSTFFRVGAGLGWEAIHWRFLDIGVRVDALALHHSVTQGTSSGGRWLPGADALLEEAIWLVPNVALVGAIGAEFAFGTTQVVVDGRDAASIPRARAVGAIGLRGRF